MTDEEMSEGGRSARRRSAPAMEGPHRREATIINASSQLPGRTRGTAWVKLDGDENKHGVNNRRGDAALYYLMKWP